MGLEGCVGVGQVDEEAVCTKEQSVERQDAFAVRHILEHRIPRVPLGEGRPEGLSEIRSGLSCFTMRAEGGSDCWAGRGGVRWQEDHFWEKPVQVFTHRARPGIKPGSF